MLGLGEKEKQRRLLIEEKQKAKERMESKLERKKRMELKKAQVFVDFKYSQKEFESAMLKLRSAAAKCSRDKTVTKTLGGLEGQNISPNDFRIVMKRNFNIDLSPKELGAITNTFDKDGAGTIATTEFMLTFFQLQRYCQAELASSRKSKDNDIELIRIRHKEEREKKDREELQRKIRFDSSHELSLMAKLKKAAEFYALDR